MAGFEVVVRPVVFPDIRPAPAQSLPPADDPDKGFAVIHGNGARQIDLSNSYSASTSSGGGHTETQRRVDTQRVYQKDKNGKINKKNYVDVEVPNKIWSKGPPYPIPPGARPDPLVPSMNINYYTRPTEGDNVEIIKRNMIKTNPDAK